MLHFASCIATSTSSSVQRLLAGTQTERPVLMSIFMHTSALRFERSLLCLMTRGGRSCFLTFMSVAFLREGLLFVIKYYCLNNRAEEAAAFTPGMEMPTARICSGWQLLTVLDCAYISIKRWITGGFRERTTQTCRAKKALCMLFA